MQKSFYYIIIFVSGFCLMVMELVAVRLVAPYVGLSIYVWTSIIGIFLLGIILGNWVGGRLADKYPSLKTCGIFLYWRASLLWQFYRYFPLGKSFLEPAFPYRFWEPCSVLSHFFRWHFFEPDYPAGY